MSTPNVRKVVARRKPAPKPASDAAVAAEVILTDRFPAIDAVGIRWLADDPTGYQLASEWAEWPLPELAAPEPEVAGYACPVDGQRYFCEDTTCAVSFADGTFADHDRVLVQPVSAP